MLDTVFFSHELLPALNRGLLVSLALIIPAGSLGFVGGVLIGCMRTFGPRWLRRLGDWYTAILRGVPLAVQLMMIYYALPKLGIYFAPYGAALTSFILCTAAYQSEYIRGALLSIRQGQIRAAQALGFSTWQTVAWIVVPQLPGLPGDLHGTDGRRQGGGLGHLPLHRSLHHRGCLLSDHGHPGHLAAALAGKTLSCAGLRRTLTKPFITTADRRTECVLLRYEPDRRPAVCCRNSDAMPLRGNVWSM